MNPTDERDAKAADGNLSTLSRDAVEALLFEAQTCPSPLSLIASRDETASICTELLQLRAEKEGAKVSPGPVDSTGESSPLSRSTAEFNMKQDDWIAACKEIDQLRAIVEIAKEALLKAEPVLRKFGCNPSGDHDDPSWCTEACGDYGKTVRVALAKIEAVRK